MNTFRRISLSLGAAALLAPSVAFAQQPAAAPAQVDEMGCVIQLMFFVTEGAKTLTDTKVPAEQRLENSTFVQKMSAALGYYEGRISARSPASLQSAGSAAFSKMQAMNQDQLVDSTMACVANFESQESRLMDQMLGK